MRGVGGGGWGGTKVLVAATLREVGRGNDVGIGFQVSIRNKGLI